MSLKTLSDYELLKNTEVAALKEREATTNLLHHLNEVARRRLFALKGCSSLFEYCVKILKLSESQSARRVNAARLLREIPEIEKKINSGALPLTTLSQAQVHFRKEERARRTKSKEANLSDKNSDQGGQEQLKPLSPIEKLGY